MWTDRSSEWMREIGPCNIHRMKLRIKKACLLIVDMQNEFLDRAGADFFHNALDIVPNVKRIITASRKAGIPVIYTGHQHEDPAVDGGMTAEWWPEIKQGRSLRKGTRGVEIFSPLAPRRGEKVIYKHRYSAFHNTDLEVVLRGMGTTDLIITGILTNVCCETTARDAFMRDFRVFVVADATAAAEPDFHIASLKNLAYAFAYVLTTDSLLRQI